MPQAAPVRLLAAVTLLAAAPARLPAAVFVLANATAEPVRFTVAHPKQPPAEHELAPGESRPFPCGRRADVTFARGGKAVVMRLDAYGAYVFYPKKGVTDLFGVELAGKPVPLDDVPEAVPAPAAVLKVPVKLLVDDADRRTQRVWEAALRRRFAQAADVVAAHCPVRFEVAAVGEWASDPAAADLQALHADFRKAVKPDPGRLAVGFTSRAAGAPGEGSFAAGAAALRTHVLVREGEPRTEPERVEVLIQQLGKYLGAVHSPDPGSVMRPKLGDGKAVHAKFRIGFDPLNTLAMNVWAEELRAGKPAKFADLRPAAQARLGRVYATLVTALPDEPLPDDFVLAAARAEGRDVEPRPEPRVAVAPKPPARAENPPAPVVRPEHGLTAQQDATRKVVRAIAQRAEQNAKAATPVRGDELTNLYVRTAADVARFEEGPMRPPAFLIGLGIALDDTDVIRTNPVAAEFCRAVESDAERKARLAVLGSPTVRDRRDLCLHFAVSAALAEMIGPGLAEKAGLAKELLDAGKPSGFSFTDLCADLAGIEFAKLTKKDPDLLDQWWRAFNIEDYVPKMDGLRDGLSEEQFKRDYGSAADDRFTRALEDVRKRVRGMRFYAPLYR